jgi:ribosomal protein L14E/L6E/L27E
MTAMQKFTVVISLAGRDKNGRFAVLDKEDEFLILSDGRKRPLERPKRKNLRHVAKTNWVLSPENAATNKALRKSLAEIDAMIGKGGL